MDQFPKSIIGETASYLPQKEYVHLSSVNRSIHLGSNSPNLLKSLNLTQIKDYSVMRWTAFPSISHLTINPIKASLITKYQNMNHPVFNNVTNLSLIAGKKHNFVETFLSQNIVNLNGVTTLQCILFGATTDRMENSDFLSLLKKCPNTEYLQLFGLCVSDNIKATEISNLCPNLIGLSVQGGVGRLNNDLIGIIGNKLKYLRFFQHDVDVFNFDPL